MSTSLALACRLGAANAVKSPFRRAISAARAAGGPYLDIEDRFLELGPELVVNGGFDADANWSKGAGVSIASGDCVFSNTNGGISQPVPAMLPGRSYVFSVNVKSISSGGLRFNSGGAGYTGITRTVAGTYTEVITPTVGGICSFGTTMAGTTATIDNISVREILSADVFQDSAGTIPATIGSTVGLLTDRSFGGELGPELALQASIGVGGGFVNNGDGSYTKPVGVEGSLAINGNAVPSGNYVRFGFEVVALTGNITPYVGGSIQSVITSVGSKEINAQSGASVITEASIYCAAANSVTVRALSVRELRGNHATQSTAGNRPVLTTHNGKPILSFNGTSNSMQLAVNPIGSNLSQPYTVVCGVVVGPTGAVRHIWGDSSRSLGFSAGGSIVHTHHGTSNVIPSGTYANGTPLVIEAWWDAGVVSIAVNGVLVAPSSAIGAPTVAAGAFFAGQRGNGLEFFNGLLLPVFATDSVVPEAQRRQIARGMAQKLGVTYNG